MIEPRKSHPYTLSGLLFAFPIRDPRQGVHLRRLFSTFACGWPGAGLLLLRLIGGIALIAHGRTRQLSGPPTEPAMLQALAMAAGILLLAGLWTPVAGSLAAIFGLWNAISQPGEAWANILLGTIGAALALVGPGVWSVDARFLDGSASMSEIETASFAGGPPAQKSFRRPRFSPPMTPSGVAHKQDLFHNQRKSRRSSQP